MVSSNDSLEEDLERLRAGLENAPPGARSFLDVLHEKMEKETRPTMISTQEQQRPGKGGKGAEAEALDTLASARNKLQGKVTNIDQHLRNIARDVDNIVQTKKEFQRVINSGAATKARPVERAISKLLAAQAKPIDLKGRTSKDVVDCVACRYAWLKVEQDLGNTYSEKALYDSFVTHCAHMQQSNIFFSACNDMFHQVDDMIGDYLNGHTVNQLCMKARMCR